MKEKLIILSDLWGFNDSPWLSAYVDFLNPHFDIVLWDSCELAGMNNANAIQEERHQFFLQGGLESAVDFCLKNIHTPVKVLTFSIGGTIAWKTSLKGGLINKLYAISATRLRYETQTLTIPGKLIYGDLDPYRPDPLWLKLSKVDYKILPEVSHEGYTQKENLPFFFDDILSYLTT